MRVEEILTEAQQDIPYDEYGYWIMPDGEVVPTAVAAHVESALRQLGLDDSELDDDYEGQANFAIRQEALGEGAIRVVTTRGEFGVDYDDPTKAALRSLLRILRVFKSSDKFILDQYTAPLTSYQAAVKWVREAIAEAEK
jgi:hypothetical protein